MKDLVSLHTTLLLDAPREKGLRTIRSCSLHPHLRGSKPLRTIHSSGALATALQPPIAQPYATTTEGQQTHRHAHAYSHFLGGVW
jgi:hypothetical protein